jgi:hypothetical protein
LQDGAAEIGELQDELLIEPHARCLELHGQFNRSADAWDRRDFVEFLLIEKISGHFPTASRCSARGQI